MAGAVLITTWRHNSATAEPFSTGNCSQSVLSRPSSGICLHIYVSVWGYWIIATLSQYSSMVPSQVCRFSPFSLDMAQNKITTNPPLLLEFLPFPVIFSLQKEKQCSLYYILWHMRKMDHNVLSINIELCKCIYWPKQTELYEKLYWM